jgi:DNA polymerase alpha subunit A
MPSCQDSLAIGMSQRPWPLPKQILNRASENSRYDDPSSTPGPSTDRGITYARIGQHGHRDSYVDTSSDGLPSDGFDFGNDPSSDDGLVTSPKKKVRTETKGIAPAIEKMGAMEVAGLPPSREDDHYNSFDDIPFPDLMETDEKPYLPIKAEP